MPSLIPGLVAESLRRSTVQIRSGSGSRQGNGSGVLIGAGQIITNAHVARGGKLTVESWEGKAVEAAVKRMDRARDLALLSAPGIDGTPATLGDSSLLRSGTPVIAVGNPLGFTGAVSSGVVRRLGPIPFRGPFASGGEWICCELQLAPGNSGGPLADLSGQVVGINTMIAAGRLAFSVPSRTVQKFLAQRGPQRSLGLTVSGVRLKNDNYGLLVMEIASGGAAEAASLLPGDILAAANGKRFETPEDLLEAVEDAPEGLLHLSFYRGRHDVLRSVTARIPAAPLRTVA